MKLIPLLFVVLLTMFGFSENSKEKMPWYHPTALTWEDFQGVPNASADYVASTNSGVSFSYSFTMKDGIKDFKFTVASYFYPKLSWYRKGQVNPYILAHEQTHFNISELHARILKKRLSEAVFSTEMKEEIKAIYEQTEHERGKMQDQFDRETEHSKIKKKEMEWEAFVSQQLDTYERWK